MIGVPVAAPCVVTAYISAGQQVQKGVVWVRSELGTSGHAGYLEVADVTKEQSNLS